MYLSCIFGMPKLNKFATNLSQICKSRLCLEVWITARVDFGQDANFSFRLSLISFEPSLHFCFIAQVARQLLSSSELMQL